VSNRVLVVDDSTTIQKIFKIAFSPYSVDVPVTSSFIEAVNEVDKTKPDVVVLDAGLLSAAKATHLSSLQSKCPDTPFVLLVGSHEKIDLDGLKAKGFSHFLKKPFEVHDILEVISEVLGVEWGHSAEEPSSSPAVPPPPPSPVPAPVSIPISGLSDEGSSNTPPPPPPIQSGGLSIGQGIGEKPPLPNQGVEPDASPAFNSAQIDLTKPPSPPKVEGDVAAIADDTRKGLKAFDGEDVDSKDVGGIDKNKYSFASVDDDLPDTKIMGRSEISPPTSSTSEITAGLHDDIRLKLESFLGEDAPVIVRKAVEDFCEKHFAALAKEVLVSELRRLAEEKSRFLSDQ